jgi:AcrR family transcriptional regulator
MNTVHASAWRGAMDIVQEHSESRSHRPSTTARRQDLHDRPIGAAETLIAGAGLANLRARVLADTAGCSVGAIYDVFPDLDALMLVVNGRTLEAIDATMRKVASKNVPVDRLVRLAHAYLDFATEHRQRWEALFQHKMPDGRPVTPWFAERQGIAFSHTDGSLAELTPQLANHDRALLARSLFAAVHGIVALGLDEKVATMPARVLQSQNKNSRGGDRARDSHRRRSPAGHRSVLHREARRRAVIDLAGFQKRQCRHNPHDPRNRDFGDAPFPRSGEQTGLAAPG